MSILSPHLCYNIVEISSPIHFFSSQRPWFSKQTTATDGAQQPRARYYYQKLGNISIVIWLVEPGGQNANRPRFSLSIVKLFSYYYFASPSSFFLCCYYLKQPIYHLSLRFLPYRSDDGAQSPNKSTREKETRSEATGQEITPLNKKKRNKIFLFFSPFSLLRNKIALASSPHFGDVEREGWRGGKTALSTSRLLIWIANAVVVPFFFIYSRHPRAFLYIVLENVLSLKKRSSKLIQF